VIDLDADALKSSLRIKEMYARYGLAMFHSQVLERGLAIALATVYGQGVVTSKDYELTLTALFKQTYGQLVKWFESSQAPTNLVEDVQRSLEQRNWLAHRYFWDRAVELMSAEGQEKAIEELTILTSEFDRIDNVLTDLVHQWAAARGFDIDTAREEELSALLNGKSPWPWP
jgi:hypothetical protein